MSRDDRRFQYWRDPLCLFASIAYVVNRWLVPAALQTSWWRGHFADVLMVPVGLPLWLWLERRIGWRGNDGAPRWGEVLFVLTIWTIAAELVAPRMFTRATGDPWDVVAYMGGALVAGVSWHSPWG